MKITSVTFGSNIALKEKYQHARIEMTATVEDGEGAADVLEKLKSTVAHHLLLLRDGQPCPTHQETVSFDQQIKRARELGATTICRECGTVNNTTGLRVLCRGCSAIIEPRR